MNPEERLRKREAGIGRPLESADLLMRCMFAMLVVLSLATGASAQPFRGTVFINPDVLTPADSSTFTGVEYTGRGERMIFDRRPNAWITVNAYLFEARYRGATLEFQVNPEFGSVDAARAEVDAYAPALGRLPAVMLSRALKVQLNAGDELFGGNWRDQSFLIHTGQGAKYRRDGFLEEALFHEAAHVSLDGDHADAEGWRAAQAADGEFISTYARDFPDREDVAETALPYFAVRYQPGRLSAEQRAMIEATVPNRLQYFDEQGFDWSPYMRAVPALPADLVVGAPSVNDNSPAAGASFTLSATVRNDGAGAAAATTLRYRRSTDATITTADRAEGTAAVAGLAAAGSTRASVQLTAPAAPGTYYYGACVDAVADEADITNNCSTSVQVTVPEQVPALPLLGQLLLALGLGAAGARFMHRRQRVPPEA